MALTSKRPEQLRGHLHLASKKWAGSEFHYPPTNRQYDSRLVSGSEKGLVQLMAREPGASLVVARKGRHANGRTRVENVHPLTLIELECYPTSN